MWAGWLIEEMNIKRKHAHMPCIISRESEDELKCNQEPGLPRTLSDEFAPQTQINLYFGLTALLLLLQLEYRL